MAELKIKADSGGGTVSFKGPATTTSNAAVQLTLPVDDGTANQYLKTDGSGALSWATVDTSIADDSIVEAKLDIHAAPSGTDKFLGYTSNGMEWATTPKGWEQVTRSSGLSGDQDIETTALFDGTYNQIMICFEHADPSSDGTDYGMRFKIDGSYVTSTNYRTSCRQWESDLSTLKDLRNTGADDFKMVWNIGNASDEWASGKIFINGPSSSSTYKTAYWQWWGIDMEGHAFMTHGSGVLHGLSNPIQGVRIYGNYGGNVGSSIISTYGLKL